MAKATASPSPKKGKTMAKKKGSSTPEPTIRRSPRKTVASAKKAQAEETAKVKKASPIKKTSSPKKVADVREKSASSTKTTHAAVKAASPRSKKAATVKTASSAPKPDASPAPKKAAAGPAKRSSPKKAPSQSPVKSSNASPRPRGRPRKSPSPAKAIEAPRPRGRPPKASSPAKVTKTKVSPKKATSPKAAKKVAAKSVSHQEPDPRLLRKLSMLSGIGDPDGSSSDSSISNEKDDVSNSANPLAALHQVALQHALAELASGEHFELNDDNQGVRKGRSRPVKGTKSGKAVDNGTSKSPKKSSPVPCPASRKSSPANKPSRSQSPAKVAQHLSSRKSSGAGARGRSQSPAKVSKGSSTRKDSSASAQRASRSPSRVTKAASPRKTSDSGVQTRSRSPVKGLPSVSREGSPTKPGRRANNETQDRGRSARSRSPAKQYESVRSTSKSRSKSPSKALSISPAKSTARKGPADQEWEGKFNAANEYGKTLRKLESKAYFASKVGKVFQGVSPNVEEDDATRARQQGVARAKAEFALRHLADSKEQRVREGYEERIVNLGEDDEDDNDDYRETPARKGKGGMGRSPARSPKLPSASRKTSASPTGRQRPPSPQRSRSNAGGRHRQDSDLSYVEEEFIPLERDQPSAPGRGAIHSVTNPEVIPGTNKKNPFFETMPGPEFWHRNQPAYFMFGETPYTQQAISHQMNEDLRKGAGGSDREPEKPRSGSFASLSNIFNAFRKSSKDASASLEQQAPSQGRSPFALADVSADQMDAMMQELSRFDGGKRRLPGGASPGKSPKRPRRMSGGNGSRSCSPPAYRMSGAL